MRKILTIALALTLCSGAAMADRVGIFADAAGTNCASNPGVFSIMTLYIVHETDGGRLAKFKVNDQFGLAPTGTSVGAGFLSIGTFATGIEIAYPTCQVGSIVIGTLGYFHQAEVMDCSRKVEIVAHPGSQVEGEVIVVDCAQPFGNIEVAVGGRAWGGTDALACGDCYPPTVATKESTWGGIKALYR